jgi:hypothetical protein
VVSLEGIAVDPSKLKEVLDWKPLTSVSEVWSFHGLAAYYQRLILSFSKIGKPITELLKKENKYVWSDACDEAFKNLKNDRMMEVPFLDLVVSHEGKQVCLDLLER